MKSVCVRVLASATTKVRAGVSVPLFQVNSNTDAWLPPPT